MKVSAGVTKGQEIVLEKIIESCTAYKDFLSGKTNILKKNMADMGVRHTLMRGNRQQLYEMVNSMTDNEMHLFKSSSKMVIPALDNPGEMHSVMDKSYKKIVVGAGGFGKVRIARNIDTKKYVAVKKTYPELVATLRNGMVSKPAEESCYYSLSDQKKAALNGISQSVVLPADECSFESKKSRNLTAIVEKITKLSSLSSDEFISEIERSKEMQQAFSKMDYGSMEKFIGKIKSGDFKLNYVPAKTNYGFQELGITTIDDLVKKFNMLRSFFESKKNTDLSEQAQDLLMKLSQREAGEKNDSVQGDDGRHQLNGVYMFRQANFKLKDAVYNQRFINTLGKKVLTALADLNEAGLSHQDIKPENIVLVKNEKGHIAVKLIDIDSIRDNPKRKVRPHMGTLIFVPPEGVMNKKSGEVSYSGEKGDAYAMGMTLRKIIGFSQTEIGHLSRLQKEKIALQLEKPHIPASHYSVMEKKLDAEIASFDTVGDFRVQTQSHVKAINATVPEALSLKDIADLMLKDQPEKRVSAKGILDGYDFFNKPESMLDDDEFSAHAQKISEFGVLADKDQIKAANRSDRSSPAGLAQLRRAATASMMAQRGQVVTGAERTGLSAQESAVVRKKELVIQARAKVAQVSRSVATGLGLRRAASD
ncbi:hypothetical protein IMCC9480_3494 [Oxalobacteraceae bacterium IMCC9480]|nr:hypothetical protein IMCC9480_3494 [Oxalobacteraceae bacterium IMCC9480]